MRSRRFIFIFLALFTVEKLHAKDVTWEEQAERLQFVSGALLDNLPMGEMPMGGSNAMVKSVVSLLPKTNSKVGSKKEDVPSSPIHGVPTLQVDLCQELPVATMGIRLWGGYLPSGSEKLVGLSASLREKSFGAGFLMRFKTGLVEPGFEAGAARSMSDISGAITAKDAEDEFHVDTLIGYGVIGVRVPSIALWGNMMAIARKSKSKFVIPADGTAFDLNDRQGPVGFQVAVGGDLFWGIQVGIGQLYLPERLTMTRVLLGIKVGF